MAEPQDDYWPADIGQSNTVTPAAMMRAQAALLGQKTNQQITANVQSLGGNPAEFTWSFQLMSPSLGSYRYELFRVTHPLTLYPATFIWEEHPNATVQNEEGFKNFLKQVIGSDQTKNIIQALLAQAVR
jgi:hypothetical protein